MLYQTVHISLASRSYPVYIGHSLLDQEALFAPHLQGRQVLIVTQKRVADLYLHKLLRTLAAYHCEVLFLPEGERYKNLSAWRKVLDHLVIKRHERSTTVLALGGGGVGDVAGFAAACYRRGVNYIQIPTTLLAQVDSAIGGKTGVNHRAGKNLIGAIHQPLCVFADLAVLDSLSEREFIAGLAEVIKCGLIRDAAFFSWLEAQREAILQRRLEALFTAIAAAVRIKGELVGQDEREQAGLRSLLNFGHTLGHALEAAFHYRGLLHGEAVAIGMQFASQLSVKQACLLPEEGQRIQALLRAYTLPTTIERKIAVEKLFSCLLQDKKMTGGQLQWVLLKRIGEAFLTNQPREEDLRELIPRAVFKTAAGR